MYACIPETGRGFFGGGVRIEESVNCFSRPTPHRNSRMVLCQHRVWGISPQDALFTAAISCPGNRR